MRKFIRNVKIALNSICSYKLQSTLSCLGIMFGAMSLVCMLSIGLGSKMALLKQLETLGDNVIIILPGRMSGRTSLGSKQDSLKPHDAEAIGKIPGIKAASPGIIGSFPVFYIALSAKETRSEVTGVAPCFREIRNWELRDGRFIEDYDLEASKTVAVIGQTVAKDLFSEVNPIGETLSIGGHSFEVIGILKEKGFSMSGRDQDNVVYIPFTAMQRRILNQNHVSFIVASAIDKESMDFLLKNVEWVLRNQHKLADYQDNDFDTMNQSEFSKTSEAMTRIMTNLLSIGAFIALITGGVGIMNIILASTRERTREIGLRMALGARRKDILSQFFLEGLMISFGGAAIGVIVGNGISVLVSAALNWSMLISPVVSTVSLLISASVGLFFAYWPARQASRWNPIDALRFE